MAEAMKEVETLLRQTAGSITASPTALRKALNDRLIMLSAEGPIGEAWGTLKAMVAGTDTYSIATEYLNVESVQRQCDGILLQKRTREYLQRLRIGAAGSTATGDPTDFAITETTAQTATLDVWPKPVRVDTLKALTEVVPFTLGESAADDIPLGTAMRVALVAFAAADLAGAAALPAWTVNAERILRREKERLYDRRSQSDISLYEA